MIQKSHPDRFAEGTLKKTKATEKLKQLNTAYDILFKYYKTNGHLPFVVEEPSPSEKKKTSPPPEKTESTPQSSSHHKNNLSHYQKKTKSGIVFLLLPVVVGAYFLFSSNTMIQEQRPPSIQTLSNTTSHPLSSIPNHSNKPRISEIENTVSINKTQKKNFDKKAPLVKEKHFTYGSSISEVIMIQGPPTKTEGDTWYYGESEVHFTNGRVTGWKHSSSSPIKTSVSGFKHYLSN